MPAKRLKEFVQWQWSPLPKNLVFSKINVRTPNPSNSLPLLSTLVSKCRNLESYLKPYIIRNSRRSNGCQVPFLTFGKGYKLRMLKKKVENEWERREEDKEWIMWISGVWNEVLENFCRRVTLSTWKILDITDIYKSHPVLFKVVKYG